tara:strand:+ start:7411 stop:7608 length:198 start_codon:yes stop_codon:yes gene_type:complete
MIKYLGIRRDKCEMCSKYIPTHSYQYVLLFKELYPLDSKIDFIICEKCAQRETGKKNWSKVKRKK